MTNRFSVKPKNVPKIMAILAIGFFHYWVYEGSLQYVTDLIIHILLFLVMVIVLGNVTNYLLTKFGVQVWKRKPSDSEILDQMDKEESPTEKEDEKDQLYRFRKGLGFAKPFHASIYSTRSGLGHQTTSLSV